MSKKETIAIIGSKGLLGSSLENALKGGNSELLLLSRNNFDLKDSKKLSNELEKFKPKKIFFCAAKVGGIQANIEHSFEFLKENVDLQKSFFNAVVNLKDTKIIWPLSNCVYPALAEQPYKEQDIFSGAPEPSNQAYAHAKYFGWHLCSILTKHFKIPTSPVVLASMYGPFDNFKLNQSHVLPSLIRRFDEASAQGAKEIILWGSGKPLREFIYAQDAAQFLIKWMDVFQDDAPINFGSSIEISIHDLAHKIAQKAGYKGKVSFDTSKPDGAMRKVLDNSKIKQNYGHFCKTTLDQGIEETLSWFRNTKDKRI